MKNKISLALLFLLTLSTTLSCSKPSNTSLSELENQFSTAVPLTDINESLQLTVDGQETSFAPNSEIKLIVYNKSPYSLYFDNDSHIKLLGSSDNLQWTEVPNAITYSATMILSPKGTVLLEMRHTSVQPILDQSTLDTKGSGFRLRIVIVGEIMDGDTRTGKKVGAYTDVILKL